MREAAIKSLNRIVNLAKPQLAAAVAGKNKQIAKLAELVLLQLNRQNLLKKEKMDRQRAEVKRKRLEAKAIEGRKLEKEHAEALVLRQKGQADRVAISKQFAAGTAGINLPNWDRFNELAADEDRARLFYAQMYEAEGALIDAHSVIQKIPPSFFERAVFVSASSL